MDKPNIWASAVTALTLALILATTTAANANDSHLEKMRGYTETMRNLAFGAVVSSSGSECLKVTHSFVRGKDDSGTVFITVRCGDGRDYMIMEGGSAKGAKIVTGEQVAAIQRSLGMPDSCWLPL